ncbi:unnamed protein product [Linum tenue]|uniref:Uncharacterized protein n=1 Tax=Linum tenue TaxID=586396 RepID=A0AAV0MY31_9ROSI|nr:unnamed protein product [Linum tenue]
MMMGLEKLVVRLKSRLMKATHSYRKKASSSSSFSSAGGAGGEEQYYYDKMEKSESMRVEIRSRKAQKLIQDTLKIADSPTTRTYAI